MKQLCSEARIMELIKKVIVAPDSFKGTISAENVADIVSDVLLEEMPDLNIVKMPIADGGEGSLDAIMSVTGGNIYHEYVIGPDGSLIEARFGIGDSGTAIIEMAESSGITRQKELHPMTSNTYGLGQLVKAALDRGAREFILCVGGSATTDGGCGMAAALGTVFTDADGSAFIPCGETLHLIENIDFRGMDSRIRDSRFTVMCDVENPLYGPQGAAYIYGPQKGAEPYQQDLLDQGLIHLNTILMKRGYADFGQYPGAGAAGGIGAGCIVFLGAELKKGSEEILKLFDFEHEASDTDLVITGEGSFDVQSLQGKVFSGIRKYAGKTPVIVVCGINKCPPELIRSLDIRVFSANEYAETPAESLADPETYLRKAAGAAAEYIMTI